jgi:hypothetical protein
MLVVQEVNRYCHSLILREKDNIPKIFVAQPFSYSRRDTVEPVVEITRIVPDIFIRVKDKRVLFIKRVR